MARVHLGRIERALVVEHPDTSLDQLLREEGCEPHRVEGAAPDEESLISLLQDQRSQVVFKRSRVPITRKVLEACPDLLAVQLCCIGDDSVDKQACADHGVMVFNDPVSNGRSVVELVIGHLVALSRRLYETNESCRRGEWEKTNWQRFEVKGKVLGVLGLGNIGRGTARAAEMMGMKIRFFDTRQVAMEVGQEFGWEPANSVVDLFRNADCVTVHLSARDTEGRSNAGILGRDVMSQLGADRPDNSPRIVLNLSRGFLHSADDLLHCIRSGAVRRAAVDVYPQEPRGEGGWVNPYQDEPRVVVTPHIGASTQEAQPRIAHRVGETFGAFSRLGKVRDCVFNPRTKLTLGENFGENAKVMLAVVHGTARGTKRAIDEAIYEAGASNLSSAHKDFSDLGVAYDLAALDRPLDRHVIQQMIESARALTGDPDAIRSVRQIPL